MLTGLPFEPTLPAGATVGAAVGTGEPTGALLQLGGLGRCPPGPMTMAGWLGLAVWVGWGLGVEPGSWPPNPGPTPGPPWASAVLPKADRTSRPAASSAASVFRFRLGHDDPAPTHAINAAQVVPDISLGDWEQDMPHQLPLGCAFGHRHVQESQGTSAMSLITKGNSATKQPIKRNPTFWVRRAKPSHAQGMKTTIGT